MENKYITVAYKLYVMQDGQKTLVEEATVEHPFQFISGLGTTLERFETEITALKKGDNHFYATVSEVTNDTVTVDLNHPHAGKDLTFEGEVVESRTATNEEIQEMVKMMSGEGCGCGCGDCGGGCGDGCSDENNCGCGHCH